MYDANAGVVFAYAWRRLDLREDAEDAVINTFIVAWRRLEEVPGEPLPWLLGVTRRVVANQLRSQHSRSALVEKLTRTISGESERMKGVAPGLSKEVERGLRALRPWEREALFLVHWEGLSNWEAAIVMGCSTPVFTLRVHRARRRLAKALGHLEIGAHLVNKTPSKETT